MRFWKMFQAWKNMVRKQIVIEVKVKAFTKRIEESRDKRYKMLLKQVIDRWKLYEKTPKANIIYASDFCSF